MNMRDDRVSLRDMLNHANEAVELLGGGTRDEFGESRGRGRQPGFHGDKAAVSEHPMAADYWYAKPLDSRI